MGSEAAPPVPAAKTSTQIDVDWPTFNIEPYGVKIVEDLLPLLFEHWKEISSDKDIPLKPVWTHYERAAAANLLRIYTIRQAGKLLGYSIFTVVQNSHYGDSIQANNDIIWLEPAMRGKLLGYRFIAWCDLQLRVNDKVQKVCHHVKLAHDWGKLLERQGYVADEIVFKKRLDLDPKLNSVEISEQEGGEA